MASDFTAMHMRSPGHHERIVLRSAVAADAARIAELRVSGWQKAYRGIVPDAALDTLNASASEPAWTQILAAGSDAACVVVAESDGDIVAFAAGMTLVEQKAGCDAELTALFVEPAMQRQGTGRRLVAAVARRLQQAGAASMVAWTLADNTPARQFFESGGAYCATDQLFSWDDVELTESGMIWTDINEAVRLAQTATA